jgi:hypothetical protein
MISLGNVAHAENLEDLEKLVNQSSYVQFDGECVRKKSNWSKSGNEYKFDTPEFDAKVFLNQMKTRSPKLHELMKNIAKLDRQDQKKYGKQFKHFIFSDLKSGPHGAKLLASAFIAKGMTLGYDSGLREPRVQVKETQSASEEKKPSPATEPTTVSPITLPSVPFTGPTLATLGSFINPTGKAKQTEAERAKAKQTEAEQTEAKQTEAEKVEEEEKQLEQEEKENETVATVGGAKKYAKIELLSDETLLENAGNNFYLLSSVSVYEQSLSVAMKKEMLKKFNQRPENVHGEMVRFIIMDSGFKEGIDLFDIKYIHIFEPQTNAADQKQVIGRGTRTCGQKGLVFQPNKGWPLYVFNYDISIPKEHQTLFQGSESSIELYLKAMNIDLRLMTLASEMERLAIYGSVDYDLNRNIHNFKRASVATENASISTENASSVATSVATSVASSGGAPKRKIMIRDDLPPLDIGNPSSKNVVEEELAIHAGLENENHGPVRVPDFKEIRKHIQEKYGEFSWDAVKMENLCGYAGPVGEDKMVGGKSTILNYTPTQDFVRHYFTPRNPYKGLLLYHSVGTGKSCSAIATATTSFEPEGYTILWVTRTTLKNDIWKNMFDQVCNERIRQAIAEGKDIPEEQAKRMRMLSPSWKIRPMSYKQFSNLVSKQNSYYKELVKINGPEDPLRKTLIIIDEAHKLYGGTDLSSIERPDTEALHASIMNSYLVSGHDSVRLLLMTATPITQDPLELTKLLNLCKLPHQQIPTDFTTFSSNYLDEDGRFTTQGEDLFLNQIIGHISYLNREKDARQFSQPVIQQVRVPLVDQTTQQYIDTYDKRLTQQGMDDNIMELKKKILEENKKLEGDLSEIDTNKFGFLKQKCDNYDDAKSKRKCNQIVRANISNIIKEVKAATKEIRDEVKNIRGQIKQIQQLKGEKLTEIKKKLLENPNEFKKYQNTLFYQLKYDCSKRVKDTKSLTDAVHNHPAIVEIDRQMESLDHQIKELENGFKLRIVAYKNRMKHLQSLLKGDVNDLEKNVLRMIIREEQRDYRRMSRVNKKEMGEQVKQAQKTKKVYQKKRHTFLQKIRKTLKERWTDKMKADKHHAREEKQLRKTMRKHGQIENDIKTEVVQNVVDKYSVAIDKDLQDLQEEMAEYAREKQEKEAQKTAKLQERVEKQQQKEAEKVAKLQERAEKQQQKEAEKTAKAQERLEKQRQKEADKAAKAALRETLKNQKAAAKNTTRKKTA